MHVSHISTFLILLVILRNILPFLIHLDKQKSPHTCKLLVAELKHIISE
jgi:hypothetical protein